MEINDDFLSPLRVTRSMAKEKKSLGEEISMGNRRETLCSFDGIIEQKSTPSPTTTTLSRQQMVMQQQQQQNQERLVEISAWSTATQTAEKETTTPAHASIGRSRDLSLELSPILPAELGKIGNVAKNTDLHNESTRSSTTKEKFEKLSPILPAELDKIGNVKKNTDQQNESTRPSTPKEKSEQLSPVSNGDSDNFHQVMSGSVDDFTSPKTEALEGEMENQKISSLHGRLDNLDHVISELQREERDDDSLQVKEKGEMDDSQEDNHDEASEKVEDSQVNVSRYSTGSLREEEILRTTELIGANSRAFIEQLRGAAFRRKAELARSRDSFAAKERQHREEIEAAKAAAAEKAKRSELHRRQSEPQPKKRQEPAIRAIPFRASASMNGMIGLPKVEKRPTTIPCSPTLGARRHTVEPNTGWSGNTRTGVVGIPKVEKRPVTIPSSPLLGARRKNEQKPIGSVSQISEDLESKPPSQEFRDSIFRARPVPQSLKAGVTGVPKVSKRATTEPCSPLLGPKRKQNVNIIDKAVEHRISENQDTASSTCFNEGSKVFRAKPLPQALHDGVSGIPYVPKRPVTIPSSPLLGPRRHKSKLSSVQGSQASQRSGVSGVPNVPKRAPTEPFSPLLGARRRSTLPDSRRHVLVGEISGKVDCSEKTNKKRGSDSSQSHPLVGLDFIGSENENVAPSNTNLVGSIIHEAAGKSDCYKLKSTERARKREEYQRLLELEQETRLEKESAERMEKIKQLRKDLNRLRTKF